jgi:hypothetical protein
VLDVSQAIASIAEVVGEMIYSSPDATERFEFERYAHQCLEAAFQQQRTGQPVAVGGDAPSHGH